MADIQVYKRVVDYVGLNAKPIPERSLLLFKDLAPVLALLQGMGSDGAKLVSVDANGNLAVSLAGASVVGAVNLALGGALLVITGDNSDTVAAQVNHLMAIARQTVWNNATWDRARSASAANLALQSGLGAQLANGSGEWSQASQPGAGGLATTSKAGVAGQRHVCKSVDFSAAAAVAPAASVVAVNLRDGASGAGTILRTWILFIAAAIGQLVPPFGLSGLNIVGSVNTAMTLEYSGAIGNLQESVSLSGYTSA